MHSNNKVCNTISLAVAMGTTAAVFGHTVLESYAMQCFLPACVGVPIIADKRFMTAYTMIERNAVYYQDDDKNELDAMFAIARMVPEEMWRTRMGLDELRNKMNARATALIAGWLKEKGVVLDSKSAAGAMVAGRRHLQHHRRTLLSPLLALGMGEQAGAFRDHQEPTALLGRVQQG